MRSWFVVLFAAACHSAAPQPRDVPPAPDAAPAASSTSAASRALDASATDANADANADAAASAPEAPALPTATRMRSPFRGTSATGLVAVASTDRRVPLATRRVSTTIGAAKFGLDRPLLVASFTKLWIAVAALRMAERGALSLDDTIERTLPELASRRWAKSTLRELLQHVSLVPEFDAAGGFFRQTDVDYTHPVTTLAKFVPRDYVEKAGIYKYRNSEFAIAGAMLAAVAHEDASKVLANEVFDPAGMKNAGLLVGRAPADLDLTPMGNVKPQNFFTAGAGYASVADLLAFFEALDGETLLTSKARALLLDGAPDRKFGALGCWAYPFGGSDAGTTLLVERPGTFGNVNLFTAYFPDRHRAVVAWTGDGAEIGRPRSPKSIGAALARLGLEEN